MTKPVLVMGDDVRSFLSIVRSLGSKGLTIDCCSENFCSHALRSRYLRKAFSLPPYDLGVPEWICSLLSILDKKTYGLIIPCNDKYIIPIMENYDEFKLYPIALPNKKAYYCFYDKYQTRKTSLKVGVPVSSGRLLLKSDTPESIIKLFGLPLIIKNRRSFDLKRIAIRNQVYKIKTIESLSAVLKKIKKPDDFLVEKYFPGVGAGISVLADNGEIITSFQHQRVNEPPDGGGSSYRKSVSLDPKLLDQVKTLARETKLTGVSMFEFKINIETQRSILVEVNARFWGSLPLAIGAGIDFPYLLYQYFILKQKVLTKNYQIDFYGRNLISDIYCHISHYESIHFSKNKDRALFFITYLFGFLRVLLGKEKIDTFSMKDPKPGILEVLELFKIIIAKINKKNKIYIRLNQKLCKHTAIKNLSEAHNQHLSIAFVCSGNICRSPFAAQYFKKIITEHSNFKIDSFGLLPIENRRCPKNAVITGAMFNINLDKHRSKYASNKILKSYSLIVVFDCKNEAQIKMRGLSKIGAVLNLAHLVELNEISDPYGGDKEYFCKIYKIITKSIDKMNDILNSK